MLFVEGTASDKFLSDHMLYEAGDLVENTVRDRWRGFGYLQSLGARSQLFYSQHATFNNVYFDLCHLSRTVVLIRSDVLQSFLLQEKSERTQFSQEEL